MNSLYENTSLGSKNLILFYFFIFYILFFIFLFFERLPLPSGRYAWYFFFFFFRYNERKGWKNNVLKSFQGKVERLKVAGRKAWGGVATISLPQIHKD